MISRLALLVAAAQTASCLLVQPALASAPVHTRAAAPHMAQTLRRRDAAALGAAAFFGFAQPSCATTTASGLQYEVVKKGKGGGRPVVGDLIAIRFKASVKASGAVFDNILNNPEAYYTRVGSGNVLAGVEEAVKLMTSGDVFELVIPPELAFGKEGRKASAGRPRIPSNAEIAMTLELSAVPGKDEEMLETIGLQGGSEAAPRAAPEPAPKPAPES